MISLGIYDASGKLVRVLHREDAVEDFTVGHDALETTWDGLDDAGNPLPGGRYSARGFVVADVKVEGVDNYFNDWVTDEDSPHLVHISQIGTQDRFLWLRATAADGKMLELLFTTATGKFEPAPPLPPAEFDLAKHAGPLIDPIAIVKGRNETVWTISHLAKGSPEVQVAQMAVDAQAPTTVLRTLPIPPNDPQPIGIAASPDEDRIFLLEQSPALERVRSLTLQSTTSAPGAAEAISDWKVDFEKKIVAHSNFALLNDSPTPVPNEHSEAPEMVEQKLRPNPLDRDRPGKVTLAVGFDRDGSFLKTRDGLPLRTVSDNGQIKRALLLAHGGDAVDVFQDDGALVEQFRISALDQMMAFDCGEFELK